MLNFIWNEEQNLLRPNRYEDWEMQISPNRDGDRWVPIFIEVTAQDKNSHPVLLKNLKWLRDQVDMANDKPPRIVMLDGERARLIATIGQINEEGSATRNLNLYDLNFIIYMKEKDIFNSGDYKTYPQFQILYNEPHMKVSDAQSFSTQNALSEKQFNEAVQKFSELNQAFFQFHSGPVQFTSQSSQEDTVSSKTSNSDQIQTGDNAKDQKIIIGIIDDAIAFANTRFQGPSDHKKNPTTRIKHLWIQELENPDRSTGVGRLGISQISFGKKLDAYLINSLLRNAKCPTTDTINERKVYQEVGVTFDNFESISLGRSWGHGTHVMDVAAGYDKDDPAGHNLDIYAVQLPTPVTKDTSGYHLTSYALQALRQIFAWVETSDTPDCPLIVNFSYGFQAGPKDGSIFLEREIDRLIKFRQAVHPGSITEVILPSGNTFDLLTSAQLKLANNKEEEISVVIHPDDRTESYVEIWLPRGNYEGDSKPPIEVTLTPPQTGIGRSPAAIPNMVIRLDQHKNGTSHPIAGLYFDWSQNTGRARILLCFNRTNSRDSRIPNIQPAMSGEWTIHLKNKTDAELLVDLHVQRDDTLSGFRPGGRQAYFDHKDAYQRSNKTGAYESEEGSPITGVNSMNALCGGLEPHTIGAVDKNAFAAPSHSTPANQINMEPFQPSSYTSSSSHGKIDASAAVDDGVSYPGIYATGIYSGSSVLMTGTSVAAPMLTRALADVSGDWSKLQKKSTKSMGDTKVRLGDFIIDFHSQPNHQFNTVPNNKRRVR